jgi:O-antigen ligase
MQKTQLNLNLIEFAFLIFTVIFIPSFEAPKNFFLVLFVTTSIYRQIKNKTLSKWQPFDLIILIYLFSALLSAIFPGIPNGNEWKGFTGMLTWALFGWAVSRMNCTKENLLFLIKLSIYSVVPVILWGIFQFVFLKKTGEFQLNSVGNVNHSATYLVMIGGALLGFLNEKNVTINLQRKSLYKIFNYLLLMLIIYTLLICQSRAAFGIFIGILIAYDFIHKKYNISILKVIILIIISMVFLFNAPILKKTINYATHHENFSGRIGIWKTAMESSKTFPLLGAGNANWKKITLDQLQHSVEMRGKQFNVRDYNYPVAHAHSLYLSALAERGWVGFYAILSLMLFWGFILISKIKIHSKSPTDSIIWVSCFSAWSATFLIGLVNSTFHHEEALLGYLYLGIYINNFKKM